MKLPDAIRKALDETGRPWSLEPMADSHFKLILDGKMVGKIRGKSKQESAPRFVQNLVAQIRRADREMQS
jgi:hypothetical protein